MSALQIPDPIPRSVVVDLCERLGLDPITVQALEFTPFGLYVSFAVISPRGGKLSDGKDAATHRIFVPYKDESP